MQAKILEGVSAATTLGNTLVEIHILCFSSLTAQGLGLSRSIESLCGLPRLPHIPHGQTWFTFLQLNQTQQKFQLDHNVLKSGRVVWLTS